MAVVEDGPWLAAFLVGQAHRGQGIGTALVKGIEDEAKRLGIGAIYTSTDSAGGLLERLDWRSFGDTHSLRGPVEIYCKTF
ncbi:MAG: GNAT family N-acetyltransferase [Hyphomicrobiales bacterium]